MNHDTANLTILIVDDDTGHRTMLETLLNDWGYSTISAADGEAAVNTCRAHPFDLVLMDVRMPKKSGLEALKEIKELNPSMPILIMTAFSNVEAAVEAIKSGAHDYLTKPLDFEKLGITLKNIFAYVELREENAALSSALNRPHESWGIIGQSQPIQQMLDMIRAIAPSAATALITGESGTGKELVAKALHLNSPRKNNPYVAFNCAAITESLMESELFGHEKGAFTGADRRRDGKFAQANTGTIFLDEIGEMPLLMQAKLLRVLQEREVQRVGGEQTLPVDVRVVTATNRDLAKEVHEGRFREDLYYRLNVVPLHLPPLRERLDDIPLLAHHFLGKLSPKSGKQLQGFTPKCMRRLMSYLWPGNVRELENVIERATVLAFGDYIDERDLPPNLLSETKSTLDSNLSNTDAKNHGPLASAGTPNAKAAVGAFIPEIAHGATPYADSPFAETSAAATAKTPTLEAVEQKAIHEAIIVAGGNKSEAAKRLGISRKTLYLKLEKYNIT